MNEREALIAALGVVTDQTNVDQYFDPASEEFRLILAAARERLAQLPETCGTCGGKGRIPALIHGEWGIDECLFCHGRGTVYPPALVGQLARIIEPNWNLHISKVDWREVAVAVLDALNGHPLEGGEKVWWCAFHKFSWQESYDRCGAAPWEPINESDCRMVERFLIPLSNSETEK